MRGKRVKIAGDSELTEDQIVLLLSMDIVKYWIHEERVGDLSCWVSRHSKYMYDNFDERTISEVRRITDSFHKDLDRNLKSNVGKLRKQCYEDTGLDFFS